MSKTLLILFCIFYLSSSVLCDEYYKSSNRKLNFSSQAGKPLTLIPPRGPVTADFVIDTVCKGDSITFTSTSTGSPAILYYSWALDNDSNFNDFLGDSNIRWAFNKSGTIIVGLQVASDTDTDTVYKQITFIATPVAGFTIDDSFQCFTNNEFKFKSTSIGADSFIWEMGDGSMISLPDSISNKYSSSDTFDIELTVFDSLGCTDSIIKSVIVYDPIIDFRVINPCVNDYTVFINNSLTCDSLVAVNWTFDSNGVFTDGSGDSVAHVYDTFYGTYVVGMQLITKSDTDTIFSNVAILASPYASFNVNDTSQDISVNNFTFTNISTDAISYYWDLRDGTTSTDTNESHIYTSVGKYDVKLVAYHLNGCKDSVIQNVYVTTPSTSTADFTINDTSQCENTNVFVLTDNSNSNDTIISWEWDFDNDGLFNDATGITRNHSFSIAGTFMIGLKIKTAMNDSAFIYKQVEVMPAPVAGFQTTSVCMGRPTVFTDNSTPPGGGSIINYYWDFDNDGFIDDTNANPSYTFPLAASYPVSLKVKADNGCEDFVIDTVTVGQGPSAAFTVQSTCIGSKTVFINTSTYTLPSDTIINFLWNFGDGRTSIVWGNLTHIFDSLGTYNVSLRALTQSGCVDSILKSVTIGPKPVINLIFDKDTIIDEGDSVIITLTDNFTYVMWSTGTQGSSIVVTDSGNYKITVVDSNGCSNERSFSISVNIFEEELTATTVVTPNGDGINDYWKILNLKAVEPCEVVIYNKWGDEIFSSLDYQNDWDVMYKGKSLPEGTYYYIIIAKDGNKYQGVLNILK